MKRFQMLKDDDSVIEFNSRTPREAALKAASRDESQIILVNESKLHIFRGSKKLIAENGHTEFTLKNKIKFKPFVDKMYYTDLKRQVDIKRKSDISFIRDVLRDAYV